MVTTRNTNFDNSKNKKKRKRDGPTSETRQPPLEGKRTKKPKTKQSKNIDLDDESDREKDYDEDEYISEEESHEFDDFISDNEEDEEELDEEEEEEFDEEELDEEDEEELDEEEEDEEEELDEEEGFYPELQDTEDESEYDPDDLAGYEQEKSQMNKNGNRTIIFFLSGNDESTSRRFEKKGRGSDIFSFGPRSDKNLLDPRLDKNLLDPRLDKNLGKRKHVKSAKKPVKRIKTNIKTPIKTLDDLIKLTETYPDKPNLEYSFDIEQAKALKSPLEELKNMVGLQSLKEQIVDQVMFLLSGLRDPNQMLHTVITGSPGCGKTTCGVILSKVYQALGYSNGKFRIVKRSDLVGEYLGHTAAKTQRVIDSIRGGVLFIDEAYSLGNQDGHDSFSKEAIDTLNQNLSMDDVNKAEFICIIAGYKKELDSCFFSMNPGLSRRFTFRYEITDYTADQLHKIYLKKLELSGWSCDPIPASFFEQNHKSFKNKGGDMEVLSQKAKIAYSRRIFGYHQERPKHLSLEDVREGLRLFLATEETKSDGGDRIFEDHIRPTMYC